MGVLIKKPCEKCGDPKAQGHHDDYSKPLDVRWLCAFHHREHHAKARAAGLLDDRSAEAKISTGVVKRIKNLIGVASQEDSPPAADSQLQSASSEWPRGIGSSLAKPPDR